MKLLSGILLATDFSESSRNASTTAICLGRAFECEVMPVHVVRALPDLPANLSIDTIKHAVDEHLQAVKGEIEKGECRSCEPILLEGAPFEEILSCAEDQNSGIVVLAAKSDQSVGPTRLGTTAERVVLRSSKPVCVVGGERRPSVDRIVCPVDFSIHSLRALEDAIHLARTLDADLTVLNVVETLASVPLASRNDKEQDEYAHGQRCHFDEFLQGFDLHGIEIEKVVTDGKADVEIVRCARDRKADLLVMGTAGRTGLARLFMGSVTEKVLQAMPCSVMTVKEEPVVQVQFDAEIKELQEHLDRGRRLLEKGLAREALHEFQRYVTKAPASIPAWEAMAAVHERLGNAKECEECQHRAEQIRDSLWQKMVQSEARKDHPLWSRKTFK